MSNKPEVSRPEWKKIGVYLAMTFLLTWGLDLIIWRSVGYGQTGSSLLLLQLQMLFPAFSAIFLLSFVFKDSPVHFSHYRGKPRYFLFFFLIYTLLYAVLAVWTITVPEQLTTASAISGALNLMGLMLLIALRFISSEEEFARAGMRGGKLRDWLLGGSCFIAFYGISTLLNITFNLGEKINLVALINSLGLPDGVTPTTLLLLMFVQVVLLAPLLGLIMGFGEEFGWRGFLQSEFLKIGKIRGIFLLGVIWGIWHYPVIWMGHNYPGYPVEGTFLMTGYTILLGFVLGYIMLKTGAIWLVAFLHALNNQVLAFFTTFIYKAESPVFSFGTGIFGLALLLIIVILLLRDPVWEKKEA